MENDLFKIFYDVAQNIPSYSHEHVHLLIDSKLAIETSKH